MLNDTLPENEVIIPWSQHPLEVDYSNDFYTAPSVRSDDDRNQVMAKLHQRSPNPQLLRETLAQIAYLRSRGVTICPARRVPHGHHNRRLPAPCYYVACRHGQPSINFNTLTEALNFSFWDLRFKVDRFDVAKSRGPQLKNVILTDV
jgi:hypothetical protein